MVLIFAKADICRGNMQVHLQFFWKSKLQSTQKGQAATQMDRSSASSETLLPSKSKCPSIKKHSVVVIIVNNSLSFYERAICREIFSKYFFASIFVNFQKILVAHENMFPSKYVLKSFRKFTKIHLWQSLMLVKLQAFTEETTGNIL